MFPVRRLGTITCQVTGAFKSGWPRGTMYLHFHRTAKELNKVWKLLSLSPSLKPTEQTSKKIKVEDIDLEDSSPADAVWLKFGGQCLTEFDKNALIKCQLLNDRHINFAQRLLHNQFPNTEGLSHTLLQEREMKKIIERGLQVIFDRGNLA